MKLKKSLGQYFLHSEKVIADIVDASHIQKTDIVVEIGPGEGVLTKALLLTGAHVVTVEKDDRLIPLLQEKFAEEIKNRQLKLIHSDILDVDMSKSPFDIKKSYKMVANIPYYITGQILRMFLESEHQPESVVLLVQKEVAERVVARDGKESLLSLSVKVFGTPRLVRTVGRGAFSPQPNVDSAVLSIKNISKKNFNSLYNTANNINKSWPRRNLGRINLGRINEKLFFELIHAGFAHKRKQLLPNLQKYLSRLCLDIVANSKDKSWPRRNLGQLNENGEGEGVVENKERIVKTFEECGIDLKSRAEDVSLLKWIELCDHLFFKK